MNLKTRVLRLEEKIIADEVPQPSKVFILPDNGEHDAWRKDNPDKFCVLIVNKCARKCPENPGDCPDHEKIFECKFYQAETANNEAQAR